MITAPSIFVRRHVFILNSLGVALAVPSLDNLSGFSIRWRSPAGAILGASTQTIGEFLEGLFPGRDITAGLKRVQTIVETLADRIPAVIERVLIAPCEMLERLDSFRPRLVTSQC